MNDFCIFEGYLVPDCSNLMWGLIDKMYTGRSTKRSFTGEAKDDNIAHAEDYLELRGELITEKGIILSTEGDLLVNLGSDRYPLIDSEDTLVLHDDPYPEVDQYGTLIL